MQSHNGSHINLIELLESSAHKNNSHLDQLQFNFPPCTLDCHLSSPENALNIDHMKENKPGASLPICTIEHTIEYSTKGLYSVELDGRRLDARQSR